MRVTVLPSVYLWLYQDRKGAGVNHRIVEKQWILHGFRIGETETDLSAEESMFAGKIAGNDSGNTDA
jgi:hypothetical protein